MKQFLLLITFLFVFPNYIIGQCNSGFSAGGQLINNGNFSAGNTGFVSVTNNSCTCGSNKYCVTTISDLKCDIYGITGNGGSGNFLMIDSPSLVNNGGAGTDVFWSQNISLTAGIDYNFSFFYHGFGVSFLGLPPAVLAIYINGVKQGGNINTGDYTGVWTKYNLNFNSGALSGPVVFEVRPSSLPPNNSGWEVGLDDFNLTTCSNTLPMDILSFTKLGDDLFLSAFGLERNTKCVFYNKNNQGEVSIIGESICENPGQWNTKVSINNLEGEVWACLEYASEKKCTSKLYLSSDLEIPLRIELYSIQGSIISTTTNENQIISTLETFQLGLYFLRYIYFDKIIVKSIKNFK